MEIKIEMKIENCRECPYKTYVYEQGYQATECTKLPAYSEIAVTGVRHDCPFQIKP